MKKIITLLTSIIMLVCITALTACGGGSASGSTTFNGDYQDADKPTATTFATAVTEESNEEITIEKGITFMVNKVESTTGNQQMTVENFVMTTTIKDSTLIAQGSFKFTAVMEVYGHGPVTQSANVKFYHDGTYLAMDIDGDKQKSELPLTNLYNYLGGETYINGALSLLNTFVTEINTIANNVDATCSCQIDDGEEFKKIKFENYGSIISMVFDTNYKLIGVQYEDLLEKTITSIELFSGEITLPDFNEFTTRA